AVSGRNGLGAPRLPVSDEQEKRQGKQHAESDQRYRINVVAVYQLGNDSLGGKQHRTDKPRRQPHKEVLARGGRVNGRGHGAIINRRSRRVPNASIPLPQAGNRNLTSFPYAKMP